MLLKAWLYGYMNRIRSQRELEKACRENVGLMWLLGRQEPDHNTLWRFWRRNREALRGLFRQVVGIAVEAGLIELVLHAVDGTKIQARSSSRRRKVLYRRNLQQALERVDRQMEEMDREMAREASQGGIGYRLPAELAEVGALRRKLLEARARLDEAGVDQLNPSEPEARMMPVERRKRLGYNAQAVVDGGSGMVVAEQVEASAVDSHQLIPMLEQTEQNLGETAEDTVADKGYRTDRALGQAVERDYRVLVQLYETEGEKAEPFHARRFDYDAEKDCCVCPLGQELVYRGQRKTRHGYRERLYRCTDWKACPEAARCGPCGRGRVVAVGPYWQAVQEQRQRQMQPREKQKLKQRKTIVEPVFAQLKHNMGFRRWSFSGLAAVRAQWALLCTVHNLKKLLQLWQQGTLKLAS